MTADGTGVELRPATHSDHEALAALWLDTFRSKFDHILGDRAAEGVGLLARKAPDFAANTVLAIADDEAVGYMQTAATDAEWGWREVTGLLGEAGRFLGYGTALVALTRFALLELYRVPPGEYYIKMLGVSERCRGRGIGRRLLGHAESQARGLGLDCLALHVVSENQGAISLYEHSGFNATEQHHGPHVRWVCGCRGYLKMVKLLD